MDLVLDCWGKIDERAETCGPLGDMLAKSLELLDRAMATIKDAAPQSDSAELVARRDSLLAPVQRFELPVSRNKWATSRGDEASSIVADVRCSSATGGVC